MKKLMLVLAAGTVAAAYVYNKKRKENSSPMKQMTRSFNRLAAKTRRSFRNYMDMSKNEAKYIKDRAQHEFAHN